MRIGNYSVLVPEGYEHGSGHVGLRHGQVYTLRIGNHGRGKCAAQIVIDGKDMGLYRIGGRDTVTLECPFHDKGRFTFFRSGSQEADAVGGVMVDSEARGLLQVRFKPEVQRGPVYRGAVSGFMDGGQPKSVGRMSSAGPLGMFGEEKTSGGIAGPGVTGLTGQSNQQFTQVAGIEHDPMAEVLISLRLVEMDKSGPRELKPAYQANPIPRPV